jgi:hypothetical protein
VDSENPPFGQQRASDPLRLVDLARVALREYLEHSPDEDTVEHADRALGIGLS